MRALGDVDGIRITPMAAAHADGVLAVYQEGIDGGQASFETAVPPWDRWDAAHLPDHRFVATPERGDEADGPVLGWVALSGVSERCVYAGVAEVSVYVAGAARGRGVGRALLDAVIASSEAAGIWTLQAGVFPENAASLALHAGAGFRVVGIRERLGRHPGGRRGAQAPLPEPGGRRGAQAPRSGGGRWRDVVLLERRSAVAGTG